MDELQKTTQGDPVQGSMVAKFFFYSRPPPHTAPQTHAVLAGEIVEVTLPVVNIQISVTFSAQKESHKGTVVSGTV